MKYIIILIFVTFLVSCGNGKKVKQTDKNTIDKKWELSVLDDKHVMGNQPIYLELNKDHKVGGFIGCNRLTGFYALDSENRIKFNHLGTTRMVCAEIEMALENQIIVALNTTDSFTLNNGKLILNAGNTEKPLAIFYEMSENDIVNKYWKLKKLEGKTIQMVDNQEKEQYFILRSDGSITGFSGCNQFNGQYELTEGKRIRFKENMAATLRACPDVAINESVFLKVFQLSDNYTINGDTLSLTIGERAPLAVFEAVYF